MNLILLHPDELADGGRRARLRGRRQAHVRDVLRAVVGDALRVGVLGGRVGRGIVLALDAESLELDVELSADPPPALAVALVLALPRPKALRRTIATVATMGVKRIAIVNAARVERSYWESPLLADEAIRAELVLGLEQARDTILPQMTLHRRFRPFVEDELPGLARDTQALVAHPGASERCPNAVAARTTLAVGPDGGFVTFELELLASAGFTAVSLGPRPLRVEQAVPALLGRLAS